MGGKSAERVESARFRAFENGGERPQGTAISIASFLELLYFIDSKTSFSQVNISETKILFNHQWHRTVTTGSIIVFLTGI